MATTIRIALYTNGDDAFVAWKPGAFIEDCRGFMLERQRKKAGVAQPVEIVENRVGFKKDKPKSGDHRGSDLWPFQRFNWTDHVVDIGNNVRYRVTAMMFAGNNKPLAKGISSAWTAWATLATDCGDGFSCFFNRGLVLSQFVARYMRDKHLSPAKFKASLKTSVDPKFRAFLAGDLGIRILEMLADAAAGKIDLHAALYELDDDELETGLIAAGARLHLILSNGSDKSGDGNAAARARLNGAGVTTVDRLLKSMGLGHNKFVVFSKNDAPKAVWTGSTNWSTTGLCTQVNNGLLIEDADVAMFYRQQWDRLEAASPPTTNPANFPPALVDANDHPKTFTVGTSKVTIQFTRTSDGSDMDALRGLIGAAQHSILFLMFTPGKDGLHTLIGKRANEPALYVRGVVSTLGNAAGDSDKNVLDVRLVSSDQHFKPDHYTVVQPQGGEALGPWIAEVTRRTFLSQIGHAIVHSKVMVIDARSANPVVVTGSHNFSKPASTNNDENLVVVTGHKKLAAAYATYVMSVYQHYRYRSYIREMRAEGKSPWSYLENDDEWFRNELQTKAQELSFWT